MTIYVQEQEMISRLSDSLKRAASRAKEITEAEETKKAEIFIDFIDNIKIAAGSSHQLAHAQENPYWLNIRDKLEAVIELGGNTIEFGEHENTLWMTIRTALLGMHEQANKLFLKKAMSRQDVIINLDSRLKALPSE
jgi:ribosome-associated translation inhibitor RaiA